MRRQDYEKTAREALKSHPGPAFDQYAQDSFELFALQQAYQRAGCTVEVDEAKLKLTVSR